MENPKEDPDTRFPLLDLRGTAKSRTASANRNMLTLFYNLQTAWKQVLKAELADGQKYDYVMFLRDDAMWLDDFDFDHLVTRGGKMTDLYTLSCDAREIPMHPLEMNDHGVVVSRSKANLFGDYFDLLFEDDIQKCNEQLDDDYRNNGTRGCNSEMIMKWILESRNVVTETVGQGMLPFQRSVHVKMPGGVVQPCLHKFCSRRSFGRFRIEAMYNTFLIKIPFIRLTHFLAMVSLSLLAAQVFSWAPMVHAENELDEVQLVFDILRWFAAKQNIAIVQMIM
jgi:hypothetical protein